jgi:hypothetical protein
MARTGLRMMPTFPSSPLKFRTAGFPRYGFKASLSDGAFLPPIAVKRAPRMPAPHGSLLRPSPASATERWRGSASTPVRASTSRCARGPASLPQGSLAPVRVMLSQSLIAYCDPIRQSRRHAATSQLCCLYATPSLCGSAKATRETFPTFATVLSTRAIDPTPVGPLCHPVVSAHRVPGCLECETSRHPHVSGSASNPRRSNPFRRCIVRFMLRLACLPGPPDWLRHSEVICSPLCLLRYRVTPAFDANRRRPTLGIRLDGRTGNLPSSGLSPDKSQQLVRLHVSPAR